MLISEQIQTSIKERFEALQNPVVVQFYETSLDCESCTVTRQLVQELTELSDLLSLEVYNLYTDEEQAKAAGIDKAPVIALTDASRNDFGIRFYGPPSGYEFATLLEDILMVSQGDSGLQAPTREKLATVTQTVDLAVFVTPTCPYCPAAVRLAHQFAYESAHVTGSMIEATEFPEWSNEFNVYGVPKTIINWTDMQSLEGAAPEHMLLDKVLEAATASA